MRFAHKKIILHRMLALGALTGAIVFFIYDLVADALWEGEFGSPHFVTEVFVFCGVSWALVAGAGDLRRLRARLEREQRRNRLFSRVLAENIDAQMDEWKMTRSGREVGWLIIKGYRFSEIARLRGVKENTSRLQASTLYANERCRARHQRARNPAFVPWHTQAAASLFAQTGRREFADFAFEINDWLLPMQQWEGLAPDLRGRFHDPRRGPPITNARSGADCAPCGNCNSAMGATPSTSPGRSACWARSAPRSTTMRCASIRSPMP